MDENNPKNYCFLIRKGHTCVKVRVAKLHLKYYECEKCIWRIQSEDPRHLKALERIYDKYGTKTW